MQRTAKWVLLCLALVLAAIPSGLAGAREIFIEEDIHKPVGSLEIPMGTTVNGSVSVNMGEIRILGVVNGNVHSSMGQVTIDGSVNGSVEASMGEVIIDGSVAGNVRASMGKVVINGAVGGNIDADLGEVVIRGAVGGDLNCGLGDLRVEGEVLGSLSSRGKRVNIQGTVEGDVTLTRGIVELGPRSVVGGRVLVEQGMVKEREGSTAGSIEVIEQLTESEINRLFNSGGISFRGDLGDLLQSISVTVGRAFNNIRFVPGGWRYTPFGWWGWHSPARALFNMAALLAMALITMTLFPRQVQAAGHVVTGKTWPVIAWGILAAILAIPLMVILAITIIGIPLILVEILLLVAAGILGYTALARVIGGRVIAAASSREANPLAALLLGVLLLGLASMIPVFGGLVSLALSIIAVGAALASRFGTIPPSAHLPRPEGPGEEGTS